MTNQPEVRLARIEALVESNARSIQAVVEVQREAESERAELRAATLGIANLLSALDEDRPTVLRRLSSIENKIDRLLEE